MLPSVFFLLLDVLVDGTKLASQGKEKSLYNLTVQNYTLNGIEGSPDSFWQSRQDRELS